MPPRHPLVAALGLALAACAPAACAFELGYSLETALGHSDNVGQSAIDPVSQSMLIPRLDFTFSEDGAYLRANAVGQIEYRDYLGGAFDNEVRGQLTSQAVWMILPYRLSMDFEDYAAVQPVNVLASNAPNNQQQTNVFTAGPTFNFHLFQTLDGEADLRATNSTASVTHEFDSNRTLGALRAIRKLSALDALSANVEAQHVHFTDASGGPDYDRYDAYARYQSKLASLDLDLAAGWSRIDFSKLVPSHSGVFTRDTLAWHASASNTFSIGYLRQFTDASQDIAYDSTTLSSIAPGGAVLAGSTPVTSEVYRENRVDGSWEYQDARFHVRAAPYYRTFHYLIDPTLDQKAHGATAGVSYRMRPLWTLAFDALEETRRYSFLARRDEDLRFDLSFTDQLTRQWSVRLDLIRNERNSSAADQGFRENVVFLTLIFRR